MEEKSEYYFDGTENTQNGESCSIAGAYKNIFLPEFIKQADPQQKTIGYLGYICGQLDCLLENPIKVIAATHCREVDVLGFIRYRFDNLNKTPSVGYLESGNRFIPEECHFELFTFLSLANLYCMYFRKIVCFSNNL